MCGINGVVSDKTTYNISEILANMNNKIIHRGPDDEGFHIHDQCVGMSMRRLAIIDLEAGTQPMYSNDKKLCIVFNGEIYNYKKLKKYLIDLGCIFKTESDTEVILKLYEKYNYNCVDYLDGMYAFSINDITRNQIFIARDKFGEKPLYYTKYNDIFLWSSELKSIISTRLIPKIISDLSLNLYLRLTYIPAPHTIYKNIYKLEQGSYLILNTSDLSIIKHSYFKIKSSENDDKVILNYENAKNELKKLMFESVESRLESDVKVGSFLSGGVDSSIISALMTKIKNEKIDTFTIGYNNNKKLDESSRAKSLSKHINSNHNEIFLEINDVLDSLNKIILNFDEPFADSSCIPTFFVSQYASKFVKVVLTGDGADELFAGYNKYKHYKIHKFTPFVLNSLLKKISENSNSSYNEKNFTSKIFKYLVNYDKNLIYSHINYLFLGFNDYNIKSLLNNEFLLNNIKDVLLLNFDLITKFNLEQLRNIDIRISLEGDMLTKVDRSSMLNSIECRSPFLNEKLLTFASKLPESFLINSKNLNKIILKDTFEYLMPLNYFNSPKNGFEFPIFDFLQNELKNECLFLLNNINLNKHNLFNQDYVHNLLFMFYDKKINNSNQLWVLFCFQKWYLNTFEDD